MDYGLFSVCGQARAFFSSPIPLHASASALCCVFHFREHPCHNQFCLSQATAHIRSDGEDVGWASASWRTKRVMAVVPSGLDQRTDTRCEEAACLLQWSLSSRTGSPYIQRRQSFLLSFPVSQLTLQCTARQSLGHLPLALRWRVLVPQLRARKAPTLQEHGPAASQSRSHVA